MRKINQALNDLKIFGMTVAQMATIATLIVSVMVISSKISSGQDTKIAVHNETAVNVHPPFQKQIDALVITDQKLADAIKAVEQSSDSNTQLIIEEIRKLNKR